MISSPPSAPTAPVEIESPPRRTPFGAVHDFMFSKVHGGALIYNCCWEDPRIDRELLGLDRDSRVVMITSAGCNALDNLLDDPAEIHAIDVNHRQNAVLELKLALLRAGSHEDLFELFGNGASPRARSILDGVAGDLPPFAERDWRKRVDAFDPRGRRPSFYYRGGAGLAAWLLMNGIFKGRPQARRLALDLLDAPDLATQREIFDRLEPVVWGRIASWLVNRPALMAMLGVPRPQIRLIRDSHDGGLRGYIREKLRHVATELPFRENYFWRVYVAGRYSRECCPNYLRPEHFETLAARQHRISTHTSTISEFLRRHPGRYTHFLLLDHQDWLAAHDPRALREEWELILANSAPDAKVLMRSAGLDIDFVPADVRGRLEWDLERTTRLHRVDRVGTYGSLHLGTVRR